MLKRSDLELGLQDLVKGYNHSKKITKDYQIIDFRDKSIGFSLGASFYVLFHFRKVRNYRRVMESRYQNTRLA